MAQAASEVHISRVHGAFRAFSMVEVRISRELARTQGGQSCLLFVPKRALRNRRIPNTAPAERLPADAARDPSRPRFAGPPCARFACSGVRQSTGLSNAALAQDDEYVSHRDGVDDSFDADAACDLLFASLA